VQDSIRRGISGDLDVMRYLDYLCGWVILLVALVFIVVIGICHPRGAVLEDPVLWTLVAMINFLRHNNGHTYVRGLRISCIAANLMAFTLEALRFGLSHGRVLNDWGPYTWAVAMALFAETIFSVAQKGDSRASD